jgi:Ca2+-transporting ATPase
MQQWWHQDIESVVEHFSTDLDTGLTEQQVGQQQARIGLNELTQKEAHSPLKLFAQQFKGFVIWVLIGAAVVSA